MAFVNIPYRMQNDPEIHTTFDSRISLSQEHGRNYPRGNYFGYFIYQIFIGILRSVITSRVINLVISDVKLLIKLKAILITTK